MTLWPSGETARVIPTGGPALVEGNRAIWVPSSPLRAIRAQAPNAKVQFDDGTDPLSAAALAASSDVAIVFVSQYEQEDWDLPSLGFTDYFHSPPIDQDAVVAAVAAANAHTVVVLETGGAHNMPWLDAVRAVLAAWYPGQRGGEAIANLLFGAVNPSGKLPITFPASVADLPHPQIPIPPDSTSVFKVDYSEGALVGYKWYDAKNLTPLFPFGFGLSYTTFSFTNATVTDNLDASSPEIEVAFDLENTGPVAGSEVAQIYLTLPAAVGGPPKRLVGWRKVFLQPGERRRVTVAIDPQDSSHPLSYWDTDAHGWRIAPGDYVIYVGNSSNSTSLTLAGTVRIGG